ncbi:MAG: hypothetical protein N7Q72_06720 [Spiroplasma sp. Tabriz.8]|nr:hypothetical protein [Spiroplasma sp. Tabriz.8]
MLKINDSFKFSVFILAQQSHIYKYHIFFIFEHININIYIYIYIFCLWCMYNPIILAPSIKICD